MSALGALDPGGLQRALLGPRETRTPTASQTCPPRPRAALSGHPAEAKGSRVQAAEEARAPADTGRWGDGWGPGSRIGRWQGLQGLQATPSPTKQTHERPTLWASPQAHYCPEGLPFGR